MRQLISIQILRGAAALLVVLFHAADIAFRHMRSEAPIFVLGGAGVDVFFVISGYVMWASTQSRSAGTLAFWKARFIRIAPLYYLATLAFVALLWAQSRLPPEFSVREIALSLLFIPFFNSVDRQDVPLLGAGWTLNCEVLFYLVFGLALKRRTPGRRFLFVVAVFCMMVALRPWVPRDNALLFRFSSPVLFEFLLGMLAAALIGSGRSLGVRHGGLLAASGLAVIAALQWFCPGLPRTVGWGLPAAGLVYGVVCCEPRLRLRTPQLLRHLGDASYSIYLGHGFLVPVIVIVVGKIHPVGVGAEMSAVLLCLFASAGLGWLLYRVIEQPIIRYFRARRSTALIPQPAR